MGTDVNRRAAGWAFGRLALTALLFLLGTAAGFATTQEAADVLLLESDLVLETAEGLQVRTIETRQLYWADTMSMLLHFTLHLGSVNT